MLEKIEQLLMVCIHDKKAEVYNPPFTARTPGEAERAFRTLCADKSTTPGMYPEDFEIVLLGHWYPDRGEFTALASPACIFSGDQLKRSVHE